MNIIETKGITKMFGDFCANSDINIAIKQGEIRAIIGENGAGKTTLMNMLYGMVQPSSGEIYVAGQKVKFASPKDAIKHKLGMVHQHFKLVPSLTVYENILLGAEMVKGGLIDNKKERQVISALIQRYKFDLNVDDKIECISVGARQRVEILKMLYRDVDVLILDEPTSVLTPGEVDDLIQNLLDLREQGKTMIIITHKLQEVKKLANTITVIRRGTVVGTVDTGSVTMEDLAQMMVGRPVIMQVDKGKNGTGDREVVYKVEHLSAQDAQGVRQLGDVSFAVRRGEVLGVAGVEGNGQSELVKVLSGMMKCCAGTVTLGGKAVTNAWPDKLRGCGVGSVMQLDVPILRSIPVLGDILNKQTPLTYLSLVLIAVLSVVLYKTKFGVYTRVCGENKDAAEAVGIKVALVKYGAVAVSAVASALAGINLAVENLGMYTNNMASGRGFICLAAIYCGKGRPSHCVLYAIIFGMTKALQVKLTTMVNPATASLIETLPYLMIVAVMFLTAMLDMKRRSLRGFKNE